MERDEVIGLVGAYRFARGGTFTWTIAGKPHHLSATRGDLFLRPSRRDGYGWSVSDAPTVIPKSAYSQRIVPAVQELLNTSTRPLDQWRRYADPRWSFEKYSASIHLHPGGALSLLHMRGRGHGSFVSDGQPLRVEKDRIPDELPAALLEAMGERAEDIAKLLR
jgi:hypothetical protein